MNIALFIEDTPSSGGAFYQTLNNIKLAVEELGHQNHISIICSSIECENHVKSYLPEFSNLSIETLTVGKKKLISLEVNRLLARMLCMFASVRESLLRNSFEQYFASKKIEIIFFMAPSGKALYISRIPIVSTVWDLAHRERPEFAEAGGLGEWFVREEIFTSVLPRSVYVLTNSIYLKHELVSMYGLIESKIKILPLSPQEKETKEQGSCLDASLSALPSKPYIIYPAKFWPHKNHLYILNALALLRDIDEHTINVLFVGDVTGVQGSLLSIQENIGRLGLHSQVEFRSALDWQQLEHAYKHSLALVMPTYFGPTNIPILEAFQLGVPVVYSDLPGFREEYGEACLYVDLMDPHSLRRAILHILKNPNASRSRIEAGRLFLNHSNNTRAGVYTEIVSEFSCRNAA